MTKENQMMQSHTAKPAATVMFVCGGAADVGELTDQAARQLRRDGVGVMSCLAGIGANDDDMMANAMFAERVLLIDGCPKACARRTFERAGLRRFHHFDLSSIGLRKGCSPVTEENVHRVTQHAIEILRNDEPGKRQRSHHS